MAISETTIKKRVKGNPLKRLLELVNVERGDVSVIYLYSVLAGVINLTLPLGIQAIIGLVQGGTTSSALFLMLGVVIVGIGFGGALQIMQIFISTRLQQRILTRASFEFAFRIPRWKLESILEDYAPELMNRFFDVIAIQKSLSKILVDFSTSILQIVFGLVLLAFYHPYFAIYGILCFTIAIIVFRVSYGKGIRTSIEKSRERYRIIEWLQELARTMNIVKLAGYTDIHLKKTDKLVTNYLKVSGRHLKVLIAQYTNIIAFKTILIGGLLVIGSLLVIHKKIELGQFVAAEIMIILILTSIEKLFASVDVVYDVLTSVEMVGQITDIEIEGDKGIAFEDIDSGKGVEIVFQNVSYTYPDDNHVTLKKLSFKVDAGHKVCVAGFPGAGRSTLISLAASMLHNYEGFITFNDITLKNLNLISLRSYVGENLSKKDLIHGTIYENISMGRDDITYHDIKEATDAVALTEYIQSTEKGFHTMIVPEDIKIPSSIVTKITMARSIAESPHLFILDEFLKGISEDDKKQIVDSLTGSDKFWTLIGASNDISFAERCDNIIVMKDGAVFDEGKFEEISKKPYFHEVFHP